MWLAVLLVLIAGLIASSVLPVWLDWRREAPLRREIQAKQVTFRIELSRVRRQEYGWSGWRAVRSRMFLTVHGDAFEITGAFPPDRLDGGAFYFRAPETTIRLSRDPDRRRSRRSWRSPSMMRRMTRTAMRTGTRTPTIE
jgi:type II secretory pathway pseudopilin PulG